MKKADLYSLQDLRLMREQRAAALLTTQRERCRDAHHELDQARETLRLHRERLVQEAERAYGRFSEGLSVSESRAIQERLEQLNEERQALQAEAEAVALTVESAEQVRERLRQTHVQQQHRSRAWQSLVEQRMREDVRVSEQRDEADQPELPAGGSNAGDKR